MEKDIFIECNPTQITQVLVNLLNNARDAIGDLSTKWIRVSVNDFEDIVEIKIIDSGKGIPLETVKKMFNPFYSTKEIGKGTGLGLSLSKTFIETHGGTFTYNENTINTEFVIVLPKKQLSLEPNEENSKAA